MVGIHIVSHIGNYMIRAIISIPSKYDHDDEKGEQRYIGGYQNDDYGDKHCDDDEDDDDDDYDDDDEKDDDDDDDWLCGKYLWKIQETPGIGATLAHFSSHKKAHDDDDDCNDDDDDDYDDDDDHNDDENDDEDDDESYNIDQV